MSQLDPDAVDALLIGRRTINKFQPERPPDDVIKEAVECARWAPNHKLTEPWHFYLLGLETAMAVARFNAQLVTEKRGAEIGRAKWERWSSMPGWLAVTTDRSPDDEIRDREDYAATCCAVHNLTLSLWARGVGVKWTTGPVTRHPGFARIVQFDPELESCVGLLWYGFPEKVPEVRRCKSVAEVLKARP